MEKKRYRTDVEILRIVAGTGIVLFHYTFRGYAADDMTTLSFPQLGTVFKYGFMGIYAFFVLSGFGVVASATHRSFLQFAAARFERIYPGFFFAACITTAVTVAWGGERYSVDLSLFFANLSLLSGYIGVASLDSVYWFLFVLLRFYFVVGVLILLRIIKSYKYVAGIWLAVSILLNFYHIPKVGFFIIPEYSTFLISGMIYSAARVEGWDLYKLVTIVVSFLFSIHLVLKGIPGFNAHYHTELSPGIALCILSCIHLYMLLVCASTGRFRSSGGVITLGLSTYPLFLIHQNVGFILFNKFGDDENRFFVLAVTVAIVYVLAIAVASALSPLAVRIAQNTLRVEWVRSARDRFF